MLEGVAMCMQPYNEMGRGICEGEAKDHRKQSMFYMYAATF